MENVAVENIALDLIFYLFAGFAVLSASMVLLAKNPVHAVLFLILTFFNAAGLFLLVGAEFLGMILVIVYVGAVAVLFLFVVMMIDTSTASRQEGFLQYFPLGATMGVILLIELFLAFGSWSVSDKEIVLATAGKEALQVENVRALGGVLYTEYVYLLQLAGVILLAAMVGAIALTLHSRPGVRRQSVTEQVRRSAKISLKDVPPYQGIS